MEKKKQQINTESVRKVHITFNIGVRNKNVNIIT